MSQALPRSIKILDFTVGTLLLITLERVVWVILNWPSDRTASAVAAHLAHLLAPVLLTTWIFLFARRVHREYRSATPGA